MKQVWEMDIDEYMDTAIDNVFTDFQETQKILNEMNSQDEETEV